MDSTDLAITTVPLGELGSRLSALRLCRPTSDEHMRRSLERHGQLTAVTAFDDGEHLQLVDGFKRLRASQRLGWRSLRVRRLALDEAMATAIIGALHEQRGLTELEEGWIVRSLCREHGLSQGAVGRLLRRHKSWVSRRLLLVEGLDATVQGDVRLGLLPPRSALALAALPRGNQRRAAELVMERGLTTRQAETLVRRLRELDSDQAREAFMSEWPEVMAASVVKQARPRSEREQLLADVAILMRVGVRLEVRLLDNQGRRPHDQLPRGAVPGSRRSAESGCVRRTAVPRSPRLIPPARPANPRAERTPRTPRNDLQNVGESAGSRLIPCYAHYQMVVRSRQPEWRGATPRTGRPRQVQSRQVQSRQAQSRQAQSRQAQVCRAPSREGSRRAPSRATRAREGTSGGRSKSNSRSKRKGGSAQLGLSARGRRGGYRHGAGRKRIPRDKRGYVPHLTRPRVTKATPVHVTLRCVGGLPSLRRRPTQRVIEAVFADENRKGFRLAHYSIQSNHLHLIAEGNDTACLSRGMQRIASRIARQLNQRFGRRGRFFRERFDSKVLATPKQVRNALRYVLLNRQKHELEHRGRYLVQLDAFSSASHFDGWASWPDRRGARAGPRPPKRAPPPAAALAAPRSWLLTTGWRRHGLLVPRWSVRP